MGRDLTADEWKTLASGGVIHVEYTYDNASGHGPTGYFTFKLEKTGEASDYAEHEAVKACGMEGHTSKEDACEIPAESYKLHVMYTAYKLAEPSVSGDQQARPGSNSNNGSAGPGTEVGGTDAGDTLPFGKGIIEKENIHDVHVICGEIEVTKKITEDLKSEKEQTFVFRLHREEDGESTENDILLSIRVAAGAVEGTSTVSNLKRGTYELSEADSDEYHVEKTVILDSTNCFSSMAENGKKAVFHIGRNTDDDAGTNGEDVIGKAMNAKYSTYLDIGNGIWGATEVTNAKTIYEADIPVEKYWSDGVELHTADAIYVVLYKGDTPLLDADGCARLLRLDQSNDWKGTFTVALTGPPDTLENEDYSVREVTKTSKSELHEWQKAVIENSEAGEEAGILYYDSAANQNSAVAVNGKAYIVQYQENSDGTFTVTNLRARELPETGGAGVYHMYTIGGLLLLAAGLMYGCRLWRRREKRTGM